MQKKAIIGSKSNCYDEDDQRSFIESVIDEIQKSQHQLRISNEQPSFDCSHSLMEALHEQPPIQFSNKQSQMTEIHTI